jgi:hypothetical protein
MQVKQDRYLKGLEEESSCLLVLPWTSQVLKRTGQIFPTNQIKGNIRKRTGQIFPTNQIKENIRKIRKESFLRCFKFRMFIKQAPSSIFLTRRIQIIFSRKYR